MKKIYLILILFMPANCLFAQSQTNARAKWFTDARFGMFIHWGVYSGAEGYWKGEKLRNDNNYAEWIFYRNRIEKKEYLTLLDRFDWSEIEPEEWVILAKKSGMNYVTFTAKHHDGFALWDSKASNYDLGDYTNPKRDMVKELAEACKKHGVKLGLYYSHWVDWEHEFGWDHNKELSGITPGQYDIYWQKKVIPQMRELLTNYGEISMIWFDMWVHHSETVVTKQQLLQLKSLIRELQPNCLINSRLGLSVEEDPDVDFKELGDNSFGNKKEEFPWQSPATVAHSWGFHATDSEWKSTTTFTEIIDKQRQFKRKSVTEYGPRANGEVPFEISQRMLEMGKWLEINGESVYGAGAFELPKDQHDWGRITTKQAGNKFKLYLHVFNWPLNKELYLTGIKTKPERIYLLADKQKAPITFTHEEVFTKVLLPNLQPDPFVPVVVVEYTEKPEVINGLVSKSTNRGFSLTPKNQDSMEQNVQIQEKEQYGTIPEHAIINKNQSFGWKIYVDEPGEKQVDVSYSFQTQTANSRLVINIAGTELIPSIRNTGKTVGEPNQNWIIDNFKSTSAGRIYFPKAGFYDVQMEAIPANNEELKFQWIWIN